MKKWIKTILCTATAVLLSFSSAYAEYSAGTIKTVKGDVNIVRNGSSIRALPKMQLKAMDQVVTGSNSSIGIVLADDTLLAYGPSTTSELKEFRYDPIKQDGNLLVSLLKGSLRFVTGLLGKKDPSSVGISLPSTTIGARGTDFIVSVEKEQ